MSAIDRMADGYEPRFDIDAAVGHQAEMFAARVADGFADGSTESKNDTVSLTTGNVYIEYECYYPRRGWQPTGPYESSAEWWFHEVGAIAFVAPVWLMREICDWARAEGRTRECPRGDHPTRGVVLSIPEFAARLWKHQRGA